MTKDLIEYLMIKKGYSDYDLQMTEICLNAGIKLPEKVHDDIFEYYDFKKGSNIKC